MDFQADFLYDGPQIAKTTFLFAHGAGAPMDSPFMNILAQGLGEAGISVVRFEFPYMQERRKTGGKRPPNTQKILLETWRTVIGLFEERKSVIIGGKSMGGRMASLIADEIKVQGLLCLGYPF